MIPFFCCGQELSVMPHHAFYIGGMKTLLGQKRDGEKQFYIARKGN